MSSGITVCLSCSISRTCSLNNSWWKLEINFSLPFDFPMLRIARWFPFKCWWASSSSLSENHLQRFALWNLNLESSGLHYCLFVKVLRCLSRDSLFNISQPSALVNNFFSFVKTVLKIFGKKRVAHYSFIFLYLQNRTLIKSLFQDFFLSWLSFRPISKCQLKALLLLHLTPIYLVVFKGSLVGYLILRGASRLDAFSVYPCRTWLLCHRSDT